MLQAIASQIIFDSSNLGNLPLSQVFELAYTAGCSGIALATNAPHIFIDANGWESPDLPISLSRFYHLPISMVFAKPYRYSFFADKGTLHWQASRSYYFHTLAAAAAINTTFVGFHLGAPALDRPKDAQLQLAQVRLQQLCAHAAELSLQMVVCLDVDHLLTLYTLNMLSELKEALPGQPFLLFRWEQLQQMRPSLLKKIYRFVGNRLVLSISDATLDMINPAAMKSTGQHQNPLPLLFFPASGC